MNSRNKISVKVNNINESKKIPERDEIKKDLFNKLSLYSPYSKEENLFNNKSHKEILLSLLKTAEMTLIFETKSNNFNTKKEKMNFIKKLISDLNQNLIYMLIEKKTKEIYLNKKINKIKKYLQNKIYNSNQEKDKNEDIKYEDFIKETEVLEKSYGGNELSKLKMLNFTAENEIQKLDFLIYNKTFINKYVKTTSIYPEERVELFCDYQKEDSKEIDESYNFFINNKKEELGLFRKEKSKQNKEIEEIKNEINHFKRIIEFEKIKPINIIHEVSQENKSLNDKSYSYKDYIEKSINISKNNNKILKNNKIESKEENILSNLQNKNLENILDLNMNINFNIKFNDYISKMINQSKFKNKNKNNYVLDNKDFLKTKKPEKNGLNNNENKLIKIPQKLIIKRKISDNEIG